MQSIYAFLFTISRSFRTRMVWACLAAVLLGACKFTRPVAMPTVRSLPDSYGSTATGDSVRLDFRSFFPDTCLIALIDTALKNNTSLAIAWERLQIAAARIRERRGALLPAVNGVVRASADRYGDYTMNGVGNFDTNLSPNINKDQKIPVSPTTDLFIGLGSNWEIDLWGKLRHLKKAAQAEWLASQSGRQFVITTLVANLATGYYNLLGLDTELKIVQKNIVLQEKALEIVEAQKEGGRANQLAVQQFRAQVLNTRAIEYEILQRRIQVENEMNTLAGRYPQQIQRDTALPASVAVTINAGVPAALLWRRPDIKQAEYEMAAAKENAGAARAAFFPALTISPYVALNAFTPALLVKPGSGAYGIGGGLTAPLFQQGQLKAQLAIAGAVNKQAVLTYQQKLYDAYSEVLTNVKAVENLKNSYRIKSAEVEELRSAVVTARDLYLTGYASYLEVITAQKNVLESELQQAEQKQRLYISLVDLYRSLGGGWNNQ
jgi:NodT family efflux transporter outer membrane factor (OMF) lipoprotein